MAENDKPTAKIVIDNVEYDTSSLSDQAKGLINTLRAADREIRTLETRLMLNRIARQTIAASLKNELDKGVAQTD
jgi:hypothetical protein